MKLGLRVRVRDDAPMFTERGLGSYPFSVHAGNEGFISNKYPYPNPEYEVYVHFDNGKASWFMEHELIILDK